MSEWTDRDARRRDADAQYEHIMRSPAPTAVSAYMDVGVVGFVFGEMWRRGGLTPRDRRWITLSCVGMADASVPMETHTYAALRSGEVTTEEIDEFVLFFGTQAGWPKGSALLAHVLAAVGTIAAEDGEELQLPRFVPWADPTDDDARRARGAAAYVGVHGEDPAPTRTVFGGVGELDFLYGEVWSRDEHLTRRDRRLVAITCAAALGIDTEMTEQLGAALRSGDLTFEELQEVVLHIAVYLGLDRGPAPRPPARGVGRRGRLVMPRTSVGPSRSTKELLVVTAERLFAERGIDGVSIRQITQEAGVANNSAVTYHFESKAGLVRAIFEYRVPYLAERRRLLWAQVPAGDLRAGVEAYFLPVAELAEFEDSHYMSFLEQLSLHLSAARSTALLPEDLRTPYVEYEARIAALLRDLPEALVTRRILMASTLCMQVCAQRERARHAGDELLPLALHVNELLDLLVGVLTAPVSDETRAVLDGLAS